MRWSLLPGFFDFSPVVKTAFVAVGCLGVGVLSIAFLENKLLSMNFVRASEKIFSFLKVAFPIVVYVTLIYLVLFNPLIKG